MGERRSLHAWAAVGGVLLLSSTGGCGQTRSIQALPPRPVVPVDTAAASLAEAGMARLEVRLEIDGAPLPEEVSTLRIRVEELRFHRADAGWVAFPSSSGVLTVTRDGALIRPILSTGLAPARYDSVEVSFGDVYVEFGANAGGPLTTDSPPRAARAFPMDLSLDATTTIRITMDPGASVFRDAACRWHFLPFLEIDRRAD